MNVLIRTCLLAMLALIAIAAQAMPCPMTALPAVSIPAAVNLADRHCDEARETAAAHIGMSLSDCLAAQPALPQRDVATLTPATPADPAPPPGAPGLARLPEAGSTSPVHPPPDGIVAVLASALWSSTQRLLL